VKEEKPKRLETEKNLTKRLPGNHREGIPPTTLRGQDYTGTHQQTKNIEKERHSIIHSRRVGSELVIKPLMKEGTVMEENRQVGYEKEKVHKVGCTGGGVF